MPSSKPPAFLGLLLKCFLLLLVCVFISLRGDCRKLVWAELLLWAVRSHMSVRIPSWQGGATVKREAATDSHHYSFTVGSRWDLSPHLCSVTNDFALPQLFLCLHVLWGLRTSLNLRKLNSQLNEPERHPRFLLCPQVSPLRTVQL